MTCESFSPSSLRFPSPSPGSGWDGHSMSPGGTVLPCVLLTLSRSCARPGRNTASNTPFSGSSPVTMEKSRLSVLSGNRPGGSQGLRYQSAAPTSTKHPSLAKPPGPGAARGAPHERPRPAGLPAPNPRLRPHPPWLPGPSAHTGAWSCHTSNNKERRLGPLLIPPCHLSQAWAPTAQRSFLQKAMVDFSWKLFRWG